MHKNLLTKSNPVVGDWTALSKIELRGNFLSLVNSLCLVVSERQKNKRHQISLLHHTEKQEQQTQTNKQKPDSNQLLRTPW